MEAHKAFQQDADSTLTGCASFAPQYDQLKVRDIITSYDRLKASIAERHIPTAEHSIRVRIYATSLGFECRLSGSELTTLSIAAEIHDIGKLQVPTGILEKEECLTGEEWSIIRMHPVWGAKIAALSFPTMPEIAQCIRLHHEHLDGSGYPDELSGYEIPMLARILCVADVFAALTEERAFRHAFTDIEALRILMHEEAERYDEYIVEMLARSRLSRSI